MSAAPSAPAHVAEGASRRDPRASEDRPRFAHDGLLWRRLARLGAAHGPDWFVRHSPAFIGVCAAILLPRSRRAVRDNLRRVRGGGRLGRLREMRDVARTFTTYAGCLAEGLSGGSKNAATPELELVGRSHMERAIAEGKGVILVTAHTAGWELALPLLREHKGLPVVMVMQPERDGGARELHDRARRATGLEVAHVGDDPFASLPLLHRLRDGAALALQLDRVPAGMRALPVAMFGGAAQIPEGPLRLAQLSGAPIVPIFCTRRGYRSYTVEMFEPVHVPRRPAPGVMEETAQKLADAMGAFVARHPTQWFHFTPAG